MIRHRSSPNTELDAVLAGYANDEPTARALLSHADPATRARALAALVRMDAATATDVEVGLVDPDPIVRRRAALLAAQSDPDVLAAVDPNALLALLPDPNDVVTEVAAFAAGEHPQPSHDLVQALIGLVTEHSDSLCRESAVAALGSIGDPVALPAVLQACTDRASVRRRAVLALAAFDDPEAEAALHRMLEDRDLQVRQAAEDLLAITNGADH